MATSEIRLYRTEITPERNAVIDDIKDFLKEKCTLTYEEYKFQYQKIDINKTITIAADQNRVGNQSLGNYCDIYQDKRHFYYFITSAEWISQNAVRLTISMDTLNTFRDKLEFTDQTTIQREHRDRFKNLDANDFEDPATDIGKKNTLRLIDKQVESLPTVKVLDENIKIKDNALDDLNWYLIYQTRDDLTKDNIANPISCALVADKELLINNNGYVDLPPQTFIPSQFTGEYYFFDPVNNPGGTFQTRRESNISGNWDTVKLRDTDIYRIYTRGKYFVIDSYLYKKVGDSYAFVQETDTTGDALQIRFTNSYCLTINAGKINGWGDIINEPHRKYIQTGTRENAKTLPFEKIDKTDSKLMKIIKLPYCPIEITKNTDGTFNIPKGWSLKNGVIMLDSYNLSDEFLNNLANVDLDKYLKYDPYVSPKTAISPKNESKLYNSEFYDYKLVYDSFSHDVRFEDFTLGTFYDGTEPIKLGVEFKPTNTVNSNFAFKFNPELNNDVTYTHRNDYENYMVIKRNNEETIFSNDYINYIRNGYNYDKKARSLGLASNIFSTIMGFGQAATTFGVGRHNARMQGMNAFDEGAGAKWEAVGLPGPMLGALRGHAGKAAANAMSPFLSAAAIGAGFNAINGVFNSVASYQQATNSMEAKKQQYAQQATNVQGSDDVDLLEYYNGNRLEIKTYTLEDNNKTAITDLFHFTGYSHPFREIPNTNNRYWFNFVQCTPVFKNENTSVYTEYLDDIKLRFEKGVTYYHHHPEIDLGWDIYQDNENWETSLLDTKYLPNTKITTVGITNSIIGEGFGKIKYIKFDIDQDYPLDTTYQAIQVKYINKAGKEMKAIKDPRHDNQFMLNFWDESKPIYARRANIMNEPLSSEWEIVYSSEATVITSSSTFADLTIKGALVNDQLDNYSYILLRGTPNELKLESDPSGETDRILPVIYQENDIYDLYVFRSNIDLNGELYGKWESWHIFEGDEEEPGWHGGRVILTQPIIIG